MAKKTNKTSHVLNLITNGEPEMPQEAAAPVPAQAPTPAPAPAPAAPVDTKVTVVNADVENNEVSEEIQKQLLSQLEEEKNSEKVDAEETKEIEVEAKDSISVEAEVQEEESVTEDIPVEAENEAPAEESAPAEAVAKAESEEKSEPKEPEPKKPEPEEPSYSMVNVMEKILERTNVMKQMNDYGVCTCSRCRADVLALVLTRLPAKYVVVDQTAANPMISFYESKFRMRILTEMIKSCIDVRDNPRH